MLELGTSLSPGSWLGVIVNDKMSAPSHTLPGGHFIYGVLCLTDEGSIEDTCFHCVGGLVAATQRRLNSLLDA